MNLLRSALIFIFVVGWLSLPNMVRSKCLNDPHPITDDLSTVGNPVGACPGCLPEIEYFVAGTCGNTITSCDSACELFQDKKIQHTRSFEPVVKDGKCVDCEFVTQTVSGIPVIGPRTTTCTNKAGCPE